MWGTIKPEEKCELVSETNRAVIHKCGNSFKGTAKPLQKGFRDDIFTIRDEIKSSNIKKALGDLGGIKEIIKPEDKVYIKSSFSLIAPSPNPKILETVVREIKKTGAEVSIIDNDTPFRDFSSDLVTRSGYYDVLKKNEIPVYSITGSEKVDFDVSGTKFRLPKFLFEKNAKLINLASMKHDLISGVSLGQKNLLELVDKQDLEQANTEELITKINAVIKPELTILDGSRACLSANPLVCEENDADFILMSNNPVCADSWGTKLLFYPVDEVKHLQLSDKMGIGSKNCNEVKKSKNPLLVANARWKQLAPSPKMVKNFSSAYNSIKASLGSAKSDDMWANVLVPILNGVKREE